MPRAGAASLDTKKGAGRAADDAALTADIVALATQYGRYSYRRITASPGTRSVGENVDPRTGLP